MINFYVLSFVNVISNEIQAVLMIDVDCGKQQIRSVLTKSKGAEAIIFFAMSLK